MSNGNEKIFQLNIGEEMKVIDGQDELRIINMAKGFQVLKVKEDNLGKKIYEDLEEELQIRVLIKNGIDHLERYPKRESPKPSLPK
ncbi:MAG: Unknown protein [uncultured Sulfurovum sp.]|uniref:Uncharacterized protein n=1 Tax=uncultured Sulfurovum sp. TaxID=269237 RepID=A0A6S6SFN8_9BACT|nr:MAG: Unknown protein [uncultured Sulfurovum sp.]